MCLELVDVATLAYLVFMLLHVIEVFHLLFKVHELEIVLLEV